MKKQVVVIAHNIRSAHNIGSLFRTCEGLGVKKLWITGYSPYPHHNDDVRLPHIAGKAEAAIQKTSLNAHFHLDWDHAESVESVLQQLRTDNYRLVALEQTLQAVALRDYKAPDKLALLLGNEVSGTEPRLLEICEDHVMIPMQGKKESFNVVQAAAMALYQFTSY